ncbi:MAG TPA: hypothetical protein VMQ60_03505 [Acidobacteriaceae bacterium]|jgi:hypothetical protein|nr:hypothetical protein [Acidobacteriaceae bacterium]
MAEKPNRGSERSDHGTGHATLYQNLMFVGCVLFGLAMIAQTQASGDGGWYWYAVLLHNGKHLYRDLYLELQPLFVLETAWVLGLLGKGWVVSKAPAVLHLVAYCVGLLLLARRSELSDGQKAVVLGCGFFVAICFEAYRFDDYHVLADCFALYCLVVLLRLQKASSTGAVLLLGALLGVLCGLTLTTRVNDGAALLVAVTIGLVCLAPSRRLLAVVLFFAVCVATVWLVVSLTGDSLRDYATFSIFHAVGSKGGTGSVLHNPLHLPVNTYLWLKDRQYERVIAHVFAVALVWVFLLRPLTRRRGWRELAMAVVGAFLGFLLLRHIYRAFLDITLVMSLSAVAVLVGYALGLLVLLRLLGWMLRLEGTKEWDRREILLLVPLGQLASGSMSSGGTHLGLYGPVGLLIVLLPICSPIRIREEWARATLLAVAALLLCSAINYKLNDPYSWHTYREAPLFTGRELYRHPVYGPMVIDRDLLAMIEPVCARVGEGGAGHELLSLPFPYANYFCNIPPWHEYVQTFFDTSSKETIDGLIGELETSPPQWILYQRELQVLTVHELIYNHGKPLEQRYLDELIERKLADGSWHAVYTSSYGTHPGLSDQWILITTRP